MAMVKVNLLCNLLKNFASAPTKPKTNKNNQSVNFISDYYYTGHFGKFC